MSVSFQYSWNSATIKPLIHIIPKSKILHQNIKVTKNDASVTKRVVFEATKPNVLQFIEPVRKTLHEISFLTPKLLFVCRNGIKILEKLPHFLNRDGNDALHHDGIFITVSKIWEQLSNNEDDIVLEWQLQKI